jgi:hypothetical protein
LLSTTVSDLHNHLTILYTTGNSQMRDYKCMLDTATSKYLELIVDNKWLPKTKQGSSFQAQGSTPPSSTSTGEVQRKHIDRTPPKHGETHSRKTTDGRWDEHWCGNCYEGGRWGNHLSGDHDAWVTKMKDRNAQRKLRKSQTAHQATTDPPPVPSPVPVPPVAPTNVPPPKRLRPAGRNTHTSATTLHRIGTYGTNF